MVSQERVAVVQGTNRNMFDSNLLDELIKEKAHMPIRSIEGRVWEVFLSNEIISL